MFSAKLNFRLNMLESQGIVGFSVFEDCVYFCLNLISQESIFAIRIRPEPDCRFYNQSPGTRVPFAVGRRLIQVITCRLGG